MHFVLALFVLSFASANAEEAADSSRGFVINGTDWFDTEGRQVAAHEGNIARFDGVFYSYGSCYANNPKGKFDIEDGAVRDLDYESPVGVIGFGIEQPVDRVESFIR